MTSWMLLRATLFLTGSAILLAVTIRLMRLRSTRLQRCAWALVLVQGVIIAPLSIGIPWYEAERAAAALPSASLAELDALAPPHGEEAAAWLPATSRMGRTNLAWSRWLAPIWLAGFTLVLAGLAVSYVALWAESTKAEPAPRSWQRELDRLLARGKFKQRVALRVHSRLGPMLCRLPGGWQILAPGVIWAQLTQAERCAVLQHELTHLRRRDVWKSLAARLLAAMHWFNPAAWWAAAKFDECAEWACDEQMAKESPTVSPVLASALLHFTHPPEATTPLAAAANGAPLCTRLKRLLQTTSSSKESKMKRLFILLVMAALAVGGAVRFRLVAQAQDAPKAPASADADAAFAKQLTRLREQLPDNGDLGQLKAALGTEEGQLVMRDRAERYVWEAQEAARGNAIANFLERRFENKGNGPQLRTDRQAFKPDYLQRTEQFNQDIEKIAKVLKSIGDGLEGDDEKTQLIRRFLSEDAGAAILYVRELRDRLRPTMSVVEYRLRELLVRDADGAYILREANREQAERIGQTIHTLVQAQDLIAKEMNAWAEDLAEPDELHRRAKKALQSPEFAVFVAAKISEDNKREITNINALANKIIDNLDSAVKDVAAGLVFQEEQREEVQNLLDRFDAVRQSGKTIKPLLVELARKIKPRDELHKIWAKVLASDVGAMKIGQDLGSQSSDVREVVMDLIGEAFTEEGNGRYKLVEARAEELSNQVQEVLRDYRRIKRRGREVERFAEKLSDEQLKSAMQSLGGKLVVVMSAQSEVENLRVDGLNKWIAEHLVRKDNGYTLADGANEALESILRDAQEVKEELKKDDF